MGIAVGVAPRDQGTLGAFLKVGAASLLRAAFQCLEDAKCIDRKCPVTAALHQLGHRARNAMPGRGHEHAGLASAHFHGHAHGGLADVGLDLVDLVELQTRHVRAADRRRAGRQERDIAAVMINYLTL